MQSLSGAKKPRAATKGPGVALLHRSYATRASLACRADAGTSCGVVGDRVEQRSMGGESIAPAR